MKVKGWPKVTVGLCVKNNERTISQAFGSITNGDYPQERLEIVVVDGMSEDKTLEALRRLSKNIDFPAMLLDDGGRGLACARQIVVDKARGKYIIWVDGDNVAPTHFVRRHVEFMECNLNVGASNVFIIPRGNTIVARLQGYQWFLPRPVEKKVNELEMYYRRAMIGLQGVICKVSVLKSVGGFDTHIAGAGEDVDLFIRMQLSGWKIGRTPNTWLYHCMRSNWKSLLSESIWWGYGKHYLSHKYPETVGPLINKRTALGLFDMVERATKTARLFRDYACFLMPLYYLCRRVGFAMGYRKAHKNGYGHRQS